MATNPSTLPENAGRITGPNAAYPYGSAKDDTTGTTGDGTPIKSALMNDSYGFFQWLLTQANIVPSGTADTALVSQLGDAMVSISGTISGSPLPWPLGTAPTGYLECAGQAFNIVTFPVLAVAYPGGVLPDLRGEFIRGFDNGRGLDIGRVIGTAQGDAIRNITASIDALNGTNIGQSPSGAFAHAGPLVGTGNPPVTTSTSRTLAFDASTAVPTAADNRPTNVAFMYIVRAV